MMAIRFKDVSFSYPGATNDEVLSIPLWAVASGNQAFIHGPSGCGKSTLLNLLSGILLPTSGEVSVFGQRLNEMSARQRDRFRANNIGYVFQQYNLIPYLSPIDNIELATYFSGANPGADKARHLLARLSVPESEYTKQVRHLSVGQQQRVAIARALINRPKLILADEPTSSLDQENRDIFLSLLLEEASEQALTVLFVSHDLTLSQHFDSVVPMQKINEKMG